MKLLTIGNPKTEKSVNFGFLTAVLHLAPSNLSGIANVCSRATKGCIAACLNTAGRGGIIKAGEITNAIQLCRIARTRFLFEDTREFLSKLDSEIASHVRASRKLGLTPAVRLNGTSDLDWSKLPTKNWGELSADLIRFRSESDKVVFYDYTKRADLFDTYMQKRFPIELAFSRAETDANKRVAAAILRRPGTGGRVAAVFDTPKGKALPETFNGVSVVDGDEHDLIFKHAGPVVIGLRAKGKARRDSTGFVVRTFPAYDVTKAGPARGVGKAYTSAQG